MPEIKLRHKTFNELRRAMLPGETPDQTISRLLSIVQDMIALGYAIQEIKKED